MTENSNQEKPSTEKDVLDKQRLELEIKERKWNLSRWGKVSRIAPFISVILLALSIAGSVLWYARQQRLETERQRQETIANLKREFASENNAVRTGAALALAEYPKEAIPVLIASLKEEDTAFVGAVKDSLKQIGKDAVVPLGNELKRLKEEAVNYIFPENVLRSFGNFMIGGYCCPFYILLHEPFELVRDYIKKEFNGLSDYRIDSSANEFLDFYINKLRHLRSSKPEIEIAHKNILEVIEDILRNNPINGLHFSGIDLSGADLRHANLIDADLRNADLSNADLTGANLSGASLQNANLSRSIICILKVKGELNPKDDKSVSQKALERETKLRGANLRRANLDEVRVVRIDPEERIPNLSLSKLTKEDLEYIKSRGAIID